MWCKGMILTEGGFCLSAGSQNGCTTGVEERQSERIQCSGRGEAGFARARDGYVAGIFVRSFVGRV